MIAASRPASGKRFSATMQSPLQLRPARSRLSAKRIGRPFFFLRGSLLFQDEVSKSSRIDLPTPAFARVQARQVRISRPNGRITRIFICLPRFRTERGKNWINEISLSENGKVPYTLGRGEKTARRLGRAKRTNEKYRSSVVSPRCSENTGFPPISLSTASNNTDLFRWNEIRFVIAPIVTTEITYLFVPAIIGPALL